MSHRNQNQDIEMAEPGTQARVQTKGPEYWREQRCFYWSRTCMPKNVLCWQVLTSCLGLLVVLCLLIFIPISFSYVEPGEYALKKNMVSNKVDVSRTYTNGRYFTGIEDDFITFNRRFRKVTEKFAIFPSNGLEFDIEVVFFYELQKDNLGKMYKAFGNGYHTQVVNRANAKIKNVAPQFTLEQYKTHRPLITSTLYEALVDELSSIYINMPRDKFHLTTVSIPDDIKSRDLDAAVQAQRNVEEQNRQIATFVRKETERQVEMIKANITIVDATAAAQVVGIVNEATAVAEKTESSADGLGMRNLFLQINVTDDDTKEKYFTYFAFLDTLGVSI